MPPVSLEITMTSATEWLIVMAPFFAAAALLLALVSFTLVIIQRERLDRLMPGRSGSLEETIAVLSRETKEFKQFHAELENYLKAVEQRLRGSIRGVGVVRFNPFKGEGAGGNQSFAVALLDERENGVVLSSLYAREHFGMYVKPIERGNSSFELTGEEREAIERARQSIAKHKKL